MDNHRVLTGAVMLETMWSTRRKDLIDLVAPFVFYEIAKKTSKGERIDKNAILDLVKTDFGFKDMPLSIIDIILKRNKKEFSKQNKDYYLNVQLDSFVSDFEGRKYDCEKRIEAICNQLVEYINARVKAKQKISKEETIDSLHGFFSRLGLFLGTDHLVDHYHEYSSNEKDYYIAQYLLEKKESKAVEYDYAIDLVKGFFLQAAIYYQSDSNDLINSSYKNVSFYFDTPFILQLLGYKSDSEEANARVLYELLKKQKGKFFYFKHTQLEIGRILSAYKNSLGRPTARTLEGLDQKRYSSFDVERIEQTWTSILKSNYEISVDNTNLHKCENGRGELINEIDLLDVLKKNIKYRDSDSVEPDMQSAIGIHNNRDDLLYDSIEKCECIFVTTNGTLVNVVNQYYRNQFGRDAFPLFITDCELSALTWIKCGHTDNSIPEMQLLKNAYMALQPSAEMIDRLCQVLTKMQGEGKLSADVASAIRSSRFTSKEIMLASFDGVDNINENVVVDIETKLRNDFSIEARLDEKKKANERRINETHERLVIADTMAKNYAQKKSEAKKKRERIIAFIVLILFFVGAVIGFFVTIKEIRLTSIILACFLCLFGVVSLFSILDAILGRKKFILNWIDGRATRYFDRIYKQKREEYDLITSS